MDDLSREEKLRLLRESIQNRLPSEETKPDVSTSFSDKINALRRYLTQQEQPQEGVQDVATQETLPTTQPEETDPLLRQKPVFSNSPNYERFKEGFRKRFK